MIGDVIPVANNESTASADEAPGADQEPPDEPPAEEPVEPPAEDDAA